MSQVIGYLVLAAVAVAITVWLRRSAAEDRTPMSARREGLSKMYEAKLLPFAQSVNARKVLGLRESKESR